MGSQFVDFNADGHIDYLTATFDGSPHIAYGSKEGFGAPVRLKDVRGERILISSIWNYEKKTHENVGRAMPDGQATSQRCISALAFDWDNDGDYDLLLGSYERGRLYLQMNEGSNKEPKFTGKNIPVMAGDKPFAIAAKMTTPRLVDWDGDGDMDLIAGSFGDSYQMGVGGGVYLSRNNGSKGKPAFGALETLIEPSRKETDFPSRPDAGLYADAVDYDGDGDLDLIVGGYSIWKPKARELSDEEKATVKRLQKQQQENQAALQEIYAKLNSEVNAATKGLERGSPEWREKYQPIYDRYRPDMTPLSKKAQSLSKELAELVPTNKRETFVWFYERK
ncbi:MAG: FG-GAP repeat domain-containing protein [Planctomycetota bacterium]|jgi:hypothetical protein